MSTTDPSPSVLRHRVRSGAYHDSIVLMRLQSALRGLDGVQDTGAVMATETNLALLAGNNLLPEPCPEAGDGDLLIAVRADDADAAEAALDSIDELLRRRADEGDDDWRPRSLRTAARILPEARWVTVSVPGRYAADVADKALELGRNVFLYSDNVSVEDERRLKEKARSKGLLVLGPDCGTATLGGTGFGFANRVRRGSIGLVAASGTGLQAVKSRVHELGGGISQAIGTGGRDLADAVGGITTFQALDLLARDPTTRVVVLISKPPSPVLAARVLRRALGIGKPVVVCFLGYAAPGRRLGPLRFARDLEEAADLAMDVLQRPDAPSSVPPLPTGGTRTDLRGLFSGGTLAYETVLSLRAVLAPLSSNLHADGVHPLDDPTRSRGHSVVDLGADELTVGRLHPMMDPELGRRRFLQEADDPRTALLLFDLVLGDVAHADPAAQWAETVAAVASREDGPEIVCLLVGTDADPQNREAQIESMQRAGARVFTGLRDAIDYCVARLCMAAASDGAADAVPPVDAKDLEGPATVWNVGLESLFQSFEDQECRALHVEWRPPAGGDPVLADLLRKMSA